MLFTEVRNFKIHMLKSGVISGGGGSFICDEFTLFSHFFQKICRSSKKYVVHQRNVVFSRGELNNKIATLYLPRTPDMSMRGNKKHYSKKEIECYV